MSKYMICLFFLVNLTMFYYTNALLYDVIMVGSILLCICYCALKKVQIVIPDVIILYIVFLIWVGLSSAWEVGIFPIKQYIVMILVGIVELMVYNFLIRDSDNISFLFKSIVITCLITGICFVGFYGGTTIVSERVDNEFMNTNVLGHTFSAGALLSLYLRYSIGEKRYYVPVLVLLGGILFSGSKGALLDFMVGCLLFFVLKNNTNSVRTIRNAVIGVIIFVIIWNMILYIPVLYNVIGYRVESFFNIIGGTESVHIGGNSNFMRMYMFLDGLIKFTDSPFIGHGFDAYRSMSLFEMTYSHSYFIERLVGLGLIGSMLYYCQWVVLIKNIKKYIEQYTSLELAVIIAYMARIVIHDFIAVCYYDIFYHVVFMAMYYLISRPKELQPPKKLIEG